MVQRLWSAWRRALGSGFWNILPLADIGRRFLVGLASAAIGVAAAADGREERCAAGLAGGAEIPRILSTSFNALISACRRSISLCRSAIAFAITFMGFSGLLSSVARRALGAAERVQLDSDCSPTRVRRPDESRLGPRRCPAGGVAPRQSSNSHPRASMRTVPARLLVLGYRNVPGLVTLWTDFREFPSSITAGRSRASRRRRRSSASRYA